MRGLYPALRVEAYLAHREGNCLSCHRLVG